MGSLLSKFLFELFFFGVFFFSLELLLYGWLTLTYPYPKFLFSLFLIDSTLYVTPLSNRSSTFAMTCSQKNLNLSGTPVWAKCLVQTWIPGSRTPIQGPKCNILSAFLVSLTVEFSWPWQVHFESLSSNFLNVHWSCPLLDLRLVVIWNI